MSVESNWKQNVDISNYHFDWNRIEPAGYDYTWVGRFEGDWSKELEVVVRDSQPKTWRSRNKNQDDHQYEIEENDLVAAGMSKDTTILRKYYEVAPIFQKMVDHVGLADAEVIFHVQYPGEMLNLHVDKQYEYNEDETKTARILIFLEDFQAGQFFQMGTSFIQWRAGDIIWFDWKNIPHATANAGWEPRPIMVVTGTITEKTKKLMFPNHEPIKV